MNDWITSTEASSILGVSPGWLRQKADEDAGFPRPIRPGARKFLWSRAAITAFRDKLISPHLSAVNKPKAKRRKG